MDKTTLLQMNGICKTFHQVRALNNVSLDLYSGEILSLMGENGAGKSTLMKILSGSLQADAGTILLDGDPVHIPSPAAAKRHGIGIIYQELILAPELTVAENIFMGREPARNFVFDWKQLNVMTETLLKKLDISLEAEQIVGNLTVAQRQLVEIAKAISLNPKILIMDEPTSALPESEVNGLLDRIIKFRDSGMGIIYISHRMDEIKQISDRVSVLRDGNYIGTLDHGEIDINKIISMMVGRSETLDFHRNRNNPSDKTVLEVKNVSNEKVKNISFKLKKSEIIGFAGLMGSGRSEVLRAIFGIDPVHEGEIIVKGKSINPSHPSNMIRAGLGFAPEDRKDQALFLEMPIDLNIIISQLYRIKSGIRKRNAEKRIAANYVQKLKIATPGIHQEVKRLSGGNQQKVVISRWLANNPDILLLDEPTRGIDVGAKIEIYEVLSSLSKDGVSIIVVSSELPELLAIADRIIVMHEGAISGELNIKDATQYKIMALATGYRDKNGKEAMQ